MAVLVDTSGPLPAQHPIAKVRRVDDSLVIDAAPREPAAHHGKVNFVTLHASYSGAISNAQRGLSRLAPVLNNH
jgi:hypothetical protein